MKDLVTVIIPTYKRVDLLRRAVESVLNQTYATLEVIVINDDNKDELVVSTIESLNDARIKYFSNNRTKGANGARNTGILNSKGQFIAFLDDDDEWLPGKLESQLACLMKKDDSFAAVFSAYYIESNKNWQSYSTNSEDILISEILLDTVKVCAGSNLLIKKKIIEHVGLWDEDLLRQQDLEFLIRVLNKYKLAFDQNITVKIYGHNTPNPKKAFEQREKYLIKISMYLDHLSFAQNKQFYSDHYRRQVIYLIRIGKFNTARNYWRKAWEFKLISFRKDLKIVLSFIKEFFKIN